MLFYNAKIIPVEGDPIPNGFIKTQGSWIQSMGSMQNCPEDHDKIDLAGKTVYPGFIDAHCHIGMWEDGLNFEGDDGNEDTDPVNPHLCAIDAVNPLDHCFQEALQAGITTVVTGPGSANPIGGSWIALSTVGRCIDRMVVANPVGIKFALGENPKNTYSEKSQAPVTRMAIAALIREQLEKARRYGQAIERAQDAPEDLPDYDAKCEALLPLLKKEIKAFFHCHRADDIFTACRLAKEFDLDFVLVHATEGHLISDELEQAPVIAGPLLCDRSKPELKMHSIKQPNCLFQHHIPTALCTDHPVIPIQYLLLTCALAIKGGLSRENALKAVTILPAKICGLDQKVGSLAAGKQADFSVFCNGEDIFSPYVSPELVVCKGEIAYARNSKKDNA